MKLVVAAATGGVGRQLVAQAREAGHEVTAVARNPAGVAPGVPVVPADLAHPDPGALAGAVAGADAVLSALGPRRVADAGVATVGAAALVHACHAVGVKRLVVVSAAPVGTVPAPDRPAPPRHDPGEGPLQRLVLTPLVRRLLRPVYLDLAAMEAALRASGLDWTAVRPPRLTDGPRTADYRTALDRNLRRGFSVSRADVAHLMLRVVDDRSTVGHTVGVAR